MSERQDAPVFASIPSPSSSGLGIGPFEVHVYGLMYAIGVALAVLITVRRWEGEGGLRETVYDVALWAFPAGLIGGRLYSNYATFHPTFLYELIWDLALAAFLVWLGHHRKIRPPGLFALYVTGYSAFRVFEESIRVDPAHHILGLRLNLYVAAVLTVLGAAWFVATQRGPDEAAGGREDEPRPRSLSRPPT